MTTDEQAVEAALQPLLEALDHADGSVPSDLAVRLEQVVGAALAVLRVDSVGLMLLDEADLPRVVGMTDDLGRVLEEAQTGSGEGPGLDTLRTGATVAVADLAVHPGYGQVWQRVQGTGLRAVLSSAVWAGGAVVGNFNSALRHPHTWTAAQVRANEAYAHVIGLALTLAAHAASVQDEVDRLQGQFFLREPALHPRSPDRPASDEPTREAPWASTPGR